MAATANAPADAPALRITDLICRACAGKSGAHMEAALDEALAAAGADRLAKELVGSELALGSPFAYCAQPNGKQASPDFVLYVRGRAHEIELKSAMAAAPVWNSGRVRRDRVYVLNLPAHDQLRPVTCVLGSRLASEAEAAALERVWASEEGKKFSEWANAELAKASPAGAQNFSYYLRHMFSQAPHVYARLYTDAASRAAAEEEAAQLLGAVPARSAAKFAHEETAEYYERTDLAHRKACGQFFTPRVLAKSLRELVARHVAPLAAPGAESALANTLEPAAGTGELACLAAELGRRADRLFLHELEPALAETLRAKFPDASVALSDFLSDDAYRHRRFGLVLANPPYVELRECPNAADLRKAYGDAAKGRANVYVLFVKKCVDLLAPDGVAAFIVPTAFRSTTGAQSVRAHVHATCEVLEMAAVGKFDTDVQQDVMLLVVRRRRADEPQAALPQPYVALVAGAVVFAEDPAALAPGHPTVEQLGCEVRTGSMVWNQNKAAMVKEPDADSHYVLYSANVPRTGGRLVAGVKHTTARSPDKAQWLGADAAVGGTPVDPPFVAVTRVSGGAKSASLRCVLVTDDDPEVAGRAIYVENHVNVVKHADVAVLGRVVAALRSEDTKLYLSQIAGSVTMTAGQLKNVPVPP